MLLVPLMLLVCVFAQESWLSQVCYFLGLSFWGGWVGAGGSDGGGGGGGGGGPR